jgi:hypothetical protein
MMARLFLAPVLLSRWGSRPILSGQTTAPDGILQLFSHARYAAVLNEGMDLPCRGR